ncbi:hypothetical protein E1287_09815 [Actinomadura sp. KC06]|uniref:hypothetical protein n=1 Tax=Actinomadura sp. KC06 TaxID=2530369 RepID=UPI001053B2F4|nr:hypothetical protein [Actinomadura sp. KC06]TDD36815.1 hypothetical protein E1287_09815 [Actinomadura sp. KC06]
MRQVTRILTGYDKNERPPAHPRHHLLCGLDISGYSRCDQRTQIFLRRFIYRVFREARRSARIATWLCHVEDRGDGILMVADPRVGPEAIFPSFIASAKESVRAHNAQVPPNELRLQLRMAIHAGYLHRDSRGFSGDAANHLARLLDAPAYKDQMTEHAASFAVIVSDDLYRQVASYRLIDPSRATLIRASVKETQCSAWMIIP